VRYEEKREPQEIGKGDYRGIEQEIRKKKK